LEDKVQKWRQIGRQKFSHSKTFLEKDHFHNSLFLN
jgi:hypothetical protein